MSERLILALIRLKVFARSGSRESPGGVTRTAFDDWKEH